MTEKKNEKNAATNAKSAGNVALYRKYRPHSFAEVVGQEHVVRVLEGAAKGGAISHAYLFSGSRGTGKTSVARIFAAEIGCSANDLYEIDAASNRGIDDVRALRESVGTLPFESPYKVYIVDEVHMLTKEAFNALKTLEEPPAHAVFILATTEVDKLPETVVSRCQTFVFKKPSREILRTVVSDIARREGFSLEPAAAELIALLGDGSFRDTEGILDKVLGSARSGNRSVSENGSAKSGEKSSKKITAANVEEVTGAPRGELVIGFISALERGGKEGIQEALTSLHDVAAQNIDMKVFLKLVLYKVRFILFLRFAPDMKEMIREEIGDDDLAVLEQLAKQTGGEGNGSAGGGGNSSGKISSKTLVELLTAYDEIGRAAIATLPIELAVMRLLGQQEK